MRTTTWAIGAMLLWSASAAASRESTRVQTAAFDCHSPTASTRAIDLQSPGRCADPTSDFRKPVEVNAVVVREKETAPLHVWHCALKITRKVTHCGVGSLTYSTKTTERDKMHLLDRDTCRKAVEEREIDYDGFKARLNGRPGAWHRVTYYSHGMVDKQGYCQTEAFWSGGVRYEGAYEETTWRVRVRRIRGNWELRSGAMQVDGRLYGVHNQGKLLDDDEGAYYWQVGNAEDACPLTLDDIYAGAGTLHRLKAPGGRPTAGEEGSVLMIQNHNDSQSMALLLGEPVQHCKVSTCYRSKNLEGYAACFRPGGGDHLPLNGGARLSQAEVNKYDLIVRDAQDEAEWERALAWSRADFYHFAGQWRLHRTLSELVHSMCQLERKTIFNKLQSVSGTRNGHAFVDLFGRGHAVTVVGSLTAYVTKCQAVNVTLADFANCTLEVPVHRMDDPDQKVYFMEPLSGILLEYPTETVCSSLMPVRWHLDGRWYCATPSPAPCSPPERIYPTLSPYHTKEDFAKDAGSNQLVKPSQLEQRDRMLARANYREAVISRMVANGVQGAGNGRVGTLLGQEEWAHLRQDVRHNVLAVLSPWYVVDYVGEWWLRAYSLLCFLCVLCTIFLLITRFVWTFAIMGCDGGRTIGKAVLAAVGIISVPLYMVWDVGQRAAHAFEDVGRAGQALASRVRAARDPPPPYPGITAEEGQGRASAPNQEAAHVGNGAVPRRDANENYSNSSFDPPGGRASLGQTQTTQI